MIHRKNLKRVLLSIYIAIGFSNLVLSQSVDSILIERTHWINNEFIADYLPQPIHYWSLFPDLPEKIYKDPFGNDTGYGKGDITAFTDRYGYTHGAVGFTDHAYIELENGYLNTIDPKNGFTITFWMYIDQNVLENDAQVFYAKNNMENLVFGLEIANNQLSVNRFIPEDDKKVPWKLWFWNPISFNQSSTDGWYQVIIVYKGNTENYEDKGSFMSVYLGKPDGTQVCRHNYFLPQGLNSDNLNWGFGNPEGSNVKALNDFIVYNTAFNDLQARASFDSAKPITGEELRFINRKSGKAASVADHSKSDNAKTWQYQWEDGNDQTWAIDIQQTGNKPDPEYRIQNVNSAKILEVQNKFIHQDGAPIVQNNWEGQNSYNQLWNIVWMGIEDNGKSFYQISNVAGLRDRIMSIQDSSDKNKAILVLDKDITSGYQEWYIDRVPNKVIYNDSDSSPLFSSVLINKESGKLLNLEEANFSFDTGLNQKNWEGENLQNWIINYVGYDEDTSKNYYRILNRRTWKPIGVKNEGIQSGDKIVQYVRCGGNNSCPNVYWFIDYLDSDENGPYFRIVNKNSNLVMQVTNGSNSDQIEQEQWNNTNDQKWYFQNLNIIEQPDFQNMYYLIQSAYSNYQLDGGSKLIKQEIIGTPWKIIYKGNGRFQIANNNSNDVLTQEEGKLLLKEKWQNAENQKWYIFKLPDTKEKEGMLMLLDCHSLQAIYPLERFRPSYIDFENYRGYGISDFNTIWEFFEYVDNDD